MKPSDPIKQGETATFKTINYKLADLEGKASKTFKYKIKEVIPTDAKNVDGKKVKDGVTYDEYVDVVNVTVTDNGKGKLVATYNTKEEVHCAL